jgi:hypothetical protein
MGVYTSATYPKVVEKSCRVAVSAWSPIPLDEIFHRVREQHGIPANCEPVKERGHPSDFSDTYWFTWYVIITD